MHLPASLAGPVELVVGSSPAIMPQHGARLENQPPRLAEKRIEGKVRRNRRSVQLLRAVPILSVGIAGVIPPAASDRCRIGIHGALEPQKQRLEITSARARNRNGIGRDFGWPPGRVSVCKDWLVYFCNASGVLEVLKQGAPSDPHRGAIRRPDPNGKPAHPDRNLLPSNLLHAAELALMKVASSLPDQDLIAQAEAKRSGRFNGQRAPKSAWNVRFCLHQRRRLKALCRPGRCANGQAQTHACGKGDERQWLEALAEAGLTGVPESNRAE